MERHLNKKARRSSGKNHLKGPRKRTEEDDIRFAESFEKLVLKGKLGIYNEARGCAQKTKKESERYERIKRIF